MAYLLYTTENERPNLPGLVQVDDCAIMPVEVPTGPDNQAGTLWYFDDKRDATNVPARTYQPGSQVWQKVGGTNVWLGTVKGKAITPESLLRFGETKFGGYSIPLNDGNKWDVPCQTELPCDFGLDDVGQVAKVPKNEVRLTYDRMTAVFEHVRSAVEGTPNTFSDQELVEYAGDLLCMNYRITWQIAALLKLFDESNLAEFLRYTTDIKAIIQLLEDRKKGGRTDPEDLPATASGEAA